MSVGDMREGIPEKNRGCYLIKEKKSITCKIAKKTEFCLVFLITLTMNIFYVYIPVIMLKAGYAWIFAALNVYAIHRRIVAEEAFLTLHFVEYADYKLRTRRLIPFIY